MLITSNLLNRSTQVLNDASQTEASVAANATTGQSPSPLAITPASLTGLVPTGGLHPSGQMSQAAKVRMQDIHFTHSMDSPSNK
jgi:hypothetical protein